MTTETPKLTGVVVTKLAQIADDRGAVLHMLRCDEAGFTRFGECYFSEMAPDAVKAWKRHFVQTQNIAVLSGRVRVVIYDEREGSLTRGALQVLDLGRPDAYFRLQIPPGLWYGFACLSTSAALIANCTDLPHDPMESEKLAIDNPRIPYAWVVVRG